VKSNAIFLAGLMAAVTIPVTAQSTNATTTTPVPTEPRMQWWRDAKYGMFIHWDPSSIEGREISWSRKGHKPLDITRDPAGAGSDPEYDSLYLKFNPTKFDAKQWVQIARNAGMKYMVITCKHHDGFAMFDTKLSDYSIMQTPFKRDPIKELADACHEAGMRFGVYYSPRDWHQPDYGQGDDSKYVAFGSTVMGTETWLDFGKSRTRGP
jgi:alpha-L-fucosidase